VEHLIPDNDPPVDPENSSKHDPVISDQGPDLEQKQPNRENPSESEPIDDDSFSDEDDSDGILNQTSCSLQMKKATTEILPAGFLPDPFTQKRYQTRRRAFIEEVFQVPTAAGYS
jgi:hypothetical protein